MSLVQEASILDAERDHALLHVFHATGVEKGDRTKNFRAFADRLRAVFAPVDPRARARQLFAALKAKAQPPPPPSQP